MGTPGTPGIQVWGVQDTVLIQEAEQTKVEKPKSYLLLRKLWQQPMDMGTQLPREKGRH